MVKYQRDFQDGMRIKERYEETIFISVVCSISAG